MCIRDRLALRVLFLKVQPAQHTLRALGLVVLHEGSLDAGGGKFFRLEGLHKISAIVTEHGGFNDHNARKLRFNETKFSHIVNLLLAAGAAHFLIFLFLGRMVL